MWISEEKASRYPGWCSQKCWMKSKARAKRESVDPMKFNYKEKGWIQLNEHGKDSIKKFKYNINDIISWVDTNLVEFPGGLQRLTNGGGAS